MKRPQPDFGEIMQSEYLQNLGFISKFIRLWGTTTVNGEEVLVGKRYFYKNMDKDMVMLAKWLKIHDDLTSQKMKGIKSAWLWLNPANDGVMDIDNVVLAENLENSIGDRLLVDVYLQPKFNNFNRSNPSFTYPDIVATVADQAAIKAEIEAKFSDLYYGGYMVETSAENRYKDAVAKYALITKSIGYEITNVSKIMDYVSAPVGYGNGSSSDTYSNKAYRAVPVYVYKISMRIDKVGLNSSSSLVTSIVSDLGKTSSDPLVDGNIIALKRSIGSIELDEDEVGYASPTSYSALRTVWVRSKGKYYLKTSFLRDNSILAKDRVAYLTSLIDSDYKQKSRSAWERFVAMVLIVVAVVLAVPSSGTSLTLTSAATFVLTVSFYLAIATIVMVKLGYEGIALALNDFMKAASPLVQIAAIISVITGLYVIYQKGKEALVQAATQAAMEGLEVGVTDAFIESVKQQFQGLLESSFTDLSLEQTTKGLNMLFSVYKELDSRDMQRQIKREEAKIAEYEEAMEQSKTRHVMMDAMRSSYNPLARDYSFYDSLYDQPYEWWATQYHTGCMQANGVSAFWTTDTKRDKI